MPPSPPGASRNPSAPFLQRSLLNWPKLFSAARITTFSSSSAPCFSPSRSFSIGSALASSTACAASSPEPSYEAPHHGQNVRLSHRARRPDYSCASLHDSRKYRRQRLDAHLLGISQRQSPRGHDGRR